MSAREHRVIELHAGGQCELTCAPCDCRTRASDPAWALETAAQGGFELPERIPAGSRGLRVVVRVLDRLGVEAAGGGGGVNVTVNVDATGTRAQGDEGRAGQFARAISEAVKNEIVTQKRPGGLLA